MLDALRTVVIVRKEGQATEEYNPLESALSNVCRVVHVAGERNLISILQSKTPDLVLLDAGPDNPGIISSLKAYYPRVGVLALPAHGPDYYSNSRVKELKQLVEAYLALGGLNEEIDQLRSELKRRYGFGNLTSNNVRMQEIFHTLSKVADTDATVLIQGESGTGKELVAKAIHYNSRRRGSPFVKVNCAAIPETLLESELFGHEKGAFTGANQRVLGKFELANHGTIFLDEIGDMSLSTQAKILRVLQEKEIERVGGRETIKIDVRVVAATNRNLAEAVASELFREDLYYRLNVVPIVLPPLRERKEDIPFLVSYFVQKFNEEFKKDIQGCSKQVLEIILNYDWPGNIRELENAIKRAVILAEDHRPLLMSDLPVEVRTTEHPCNQPVPRAAETQPGLSLRETTKQTVASLEKQAILETLEKCGWNISRSARELGVTRRTLYKKLDQYNIRRPPAETREA